MLELIGVRKEYKTKAGETAALDGISLRFPRAGLVFITGKSGSGKTTLLNVIGGLDEFDGGDVKVQGRSFSSFSTADFDSYRNTFVGFIFQEYNLLSEYTVRKNVAFADELQGKKCNAEQMKRLFEEVEIAGLEERKPSQLSGGQKQRVAIVRALVKSSKIILADELTGALDSATGEQVMQVLKKISKEKLIIVVSHDLELAEKYADRIIRLIDGRVAEDITLTDEEAAGNMHEQDGVLTVKKRSALTKAEQVRLIAAIQDGKNVEFTDSISVRRRSKTLRTDEESPCAAEPLIRSKMKLSSAVYLGVKALVVKPWRLLLTVLLSVVAFAGFGVLDSIASFSNAKAIEGALKGGYYSSLPLYATYKSEEYDGASVKLSQASIDEINKATGYKFKGVYDLKEDEYLVGTEIPERANFNKSHEIQGLPSNYKKAPVWSAYYGRSFNGMLAFSESEIAGNVLSPDGFDYKIVYGAYPTAEEENGVAISSYMAESIMQWARMDTGFFGGKNIQTAEDFIGAQFTVAERYFEITGIIDCGAIPDKYAALKTKEDLALQSDFNTYISAGGYVCLFVTPSYIENSRRENQLVTCYYNDYTKVQKATMESRALPLSEYYHDTREIGNQNIIYFREEYTVKENEVVIHIEDFIDEYLYAETYSGVAAPEELEELRLAKRYIEVGEIDKVRAMWFTTLRPTVERIQSRSPSLNQGLMKEITVQSYAKDGSTVKQSKTFTVVGTYYGVSSGGKKKYLETRWNALATTKENLEALHIPTEQGIYSRIVAPLRKNAKGERAIAKMMDVDGGLELRWYQNPILETVEAERELLSQFLELFLYAALVLAVFSFVMLFNYLSVSILSKKQSVGVLRALGANAKNILTTFLVESLCIALVNGALGCIVASVACVLVNSYLINVMNLTFRMATFGLRQIVLLLSGSLLAGVSATVLPIVKIAREKPVNLIKRP